VTLRPVSRAIVARYVSTLTMSVTSLPRMRSTVIDAGSGASSSYPIVRCPRRSRAGHRTRGGQGVPARGGFADPASSTATTWPSLTSFEPATGASTCATGARIGCSSKTIEIANWSGSAVVSFGPQYPRPGIARGPRGRGGVCARRPLRRRAAGRCRVRGRSSRRRDGWQERSRDVGSEGPVGVVTQGDAPVLAGEDDLGREGEAGEPQRVDVDAVDVGASRARGSDGVRRGDRIAMRGGRGETFGDLACGAARGVELRGTGVVDDLPGRRAAGGQQRGMLDDGGQDAEVAGRERATAVPMGKCVDSWRSPPDSPLLPRTIEAPHSSAAIALALTAVGWV